MKKNFKKSLQNVTELVKEDLLSVNNLILQKMHSDIDLIPKLASHIINSGGKRIRPLLTLTTAKMLGYNGVRHVILAACVEFIHTATLLHDDVVDESDTRRGLVTSNQIWGNKASVLVGDFLFSRAFELMVQDGSLKVLEVLSTASSTIAQGEIMQMLTANNLDTSQEQYLKVIFAKTACLFSAATTISGVITNQSEKIIKSLENFGINLGIAFQIIDDILDYSAKQEILGKTIGNDFKEGKITLPVILCFNKATKSEKAFMQRTLVNQEQLPNDFIGALSIMNKYHILEETSRIAADYANLAINAIDTFPNSPIKSALIDLAMDSIERTH